MGCLPDLRLDGHDCVTGGVMFPRGFGVTSTVGGTEGAA